MAIFGVFSGNKQPDQIMTTLDLVTRTAGLASNPNDIDLLLDQVRTITVRLKPGQQPSAAENAQLVDTYLQLETYLMTKEPIRAFTKQDLRMRISPAVLQLITARETNNNGKDVAQTGATI